MYMSLESEFELLVNSYRPIELTTGYLLAQYTLRLHSIYYEVSYQLTIHFDCYYEDKSGVHIKIKINIWNAYLAMEMLFCISYRSREWCLHIAV